MCTSQSCLISSLSPLNSFLSAKKKTLWSLERALSLLLLPPQRLGPEPPGSALRSWSTAPKMLALLTLKVPSAAPHPSPPSVHLLAFNNILFLPHFMIMQTGNSVLYYETKCMHVCVMHVSVMQVQ